MLLEHGHYVGHTLSVYGDFTPGKKASLPDRPRHS